MKNVNISLRKVLQALWELEEKQGRKCTLMGVSPMSENIIRAMLELGRDEDFPVMFIASRNQVDLKKLGGGYILDWDQRKFVETVNRIAGEAGFKGILFICRDHGGPWRRDNERIEKLPEQEAMKRAKSSYLADLLAGFEVLHIDPTMDPHIDGYVPIDLVIKRTVELIEAAEKERINRKMEPLSYEVGTEDIAGGLTESGIFDKFLTDLLKELDNHSLPHPDFIVGQTGTLLKMNRNVGRFDAEKSKELASIAKNYGIGFKEHNADFLDQETLRLHPRLGITAANVGPEFSIAETGAYLRFEKMEEEAIAERKIRKPSRFLTVVQEAVLKSGRWKKWLTKSESRLTESELAGNPDKLNEIVLVAARYVFDQDEVKKAIRELFTNLRNAGLVKDPAREIVQTLKKSIGSWVESLNLKGITSKILGKA